MPRTLKALIIEDSEDDALLVTRELRRGGFDVVYERVETAAAMHTALQGRPWDVVISDFTMPHFSGLDALKVLQNSGLDLPFLLVSGVAGEELGVEAMRAGAHDYLMKRNLGRLVPALERELREAETRRTRSKDEDLLHLRTEALSAAANGIMITNVEGAIVWVNAALTTLTGYTAAELLGRNPRILKSGRQDQAFYANLWNTILDGRVWHGEIINRRKAGTLYIEEMTITPVRGRDRNIAHFIAVRQDVTEQKRAQGALQTSEIRYRRLFEAAQDGILLLDSETSAITDVNPFLIDLLGYEPEEMLGKKLWDIGPFRDVLASKSAFRDLQDGGHIRYEDLPLETKSGHSIAVEFVSNTYMADGKKVIQCNIRDITNRKRAEDSLRETQLELAIKNRIANIFLTVPDRSVFGEVLRAVLDVTQSEEGIFGHFDEEGLLVRSSIGRTGAAAELIAQTRTIRPEEWDSAAGRFLREKRSVYSNQMGYLPESEVPVQRSLIVPVVYQDEVIGRLAVANKATDYNEADKGLLERIAVYLAPVLKARLQRDAHVKALSTALAAKQVLLQEVHHRVKNNLQTISSLLNLQAESLPKASQTALEDSRLRVQSMAMVHEQLYSRDDPGELDFAEYATCLTTGLWNGYRDESGRVRLRLEVDSVLLGVNQAIPCGLILNELVTNAFKYAFPESRSGEVLVGLHSQESGQVTLRVADNGVGLPPGLDWKQAKSLGLRILQILTQQLNGTLCAKPGGGADFTLTFAKR